jgi:hypothetical protein
MTITRDNLPKTLDEAVGRLLSELPLRYRIEITRMKEEHLQNLHSTIGVYIKNQFGLWTENRELMEACISRGVNAFPNPDVASHVIIRALWKRLQKTHSLRLVK